MSLICEFRLHSYSSSTSMEPMKTETEKTERDNLDGADE